MSIGKRASDQRDIHRKWLVAQQLAAIDIYHLDQVVLGRIIHASASNTRIDERAETDVREQPRPLGSDLTEQLHGDAAGQDIGFDLVLARHLLHARRPDPMPADNALHHTFVGKAIHATRLTVANSQRMDCRQTARMAGLEKSLLDGRE